VHDSGSSVEWIIRFSSTYYMRVDMLDG